MQNNANNKQTVMNNEQEKAANGLSLSEIRKVVADQMHGYGSVDGMSVTKLVKLLGSAITSKKAEYDLSFVKDDGVWYIDLPSWPWKRENLAMVCGADKMLDLLAFDSSSFNRESIRVHVDAKPIGEVTVFEDYRPCGSTPLFDAMGMSITRLHETVKNDEDASAIVTVMTDGLENASYEYSDRQIKALI